MAVFDNCSVLFELRGLSFKEKKTVKSAVTDHGGNLSFVVNKQVRELSARGEGGLLTAECSNETLLQLYLKRAFFFGTCCVHIELQHVTISV